MKIAHVVTYVSPDGAFGGPSRVALGQAAALAELGHEVTVFAAAPAHLAGEVAEDGYILRTFAAHRLIPGNGFATMRAPRLTHALRMEIRSFDVVHVHLARDLVTLPAAQVARKAGVNYVVQPHGMIDASDRFLARPLDAFATRPVLRGARAVLVLTDREDRDIRGLEARIRMRRIGNGIRVDALPPYEGRKNLVLFLARLQQRKRPVAFVQMAALLAERFPDVEFVLVGPDEGEGGATLKAIELSGLARRVWWAGPASPDEAEAWISSALVYVLPAFGEVFPMTILESFRAGTPVVTTDSLGIAAACERYGSAIVTDGSPAELANAVAQILEVPNLADSLRVGGHEYLRSELDIAVISQELEAIYLG